MTQIRVRIVATGRVVYVDADTASAWAAAGYAVAISPPVPVRMQGVTPVETR